MQSRRQLQSLFKKPNHTEPNRSWTDQLTVQKVVPKRAAQRWIPKPAYAQTRYNLYLLFLILLSTSSSVLRQVCGHRSLSTPLRTRNSIRNPHYRHVKISTMHRCEDVLYLLPANDSTLTDCIGNPANQKYIRSIRACGAHLPQNSIVLSLDSPPKILRIGSLEVATLILSKSV